METVKISVRQIVEFVLRSGDIDSRYVDSSVMQEGSRAHRRIQKDMGDGYLSEVSLRLLKVAGDVSVLLQGRADGVIYGPAKGRVTIHEIKTTVQPLDHLARQQELHLAQAKCYGHMLWASPALAEAPGEIGVRLTYYQLDTDERRDMEFVYTAEELAAFTEELFNCYGVWLRFERDWRELRDRSISETPFPFSSYRKGQRELAVACYRTIERKKKLYAQAPTGIGKTIAVLFPAVKAQGQGVGGKIFYLTAKTVVRTVVEEAVRKMAARGLRLKSVTMRAKEKICFCEETLCQPEACAYARGHFDRVNAALLDILEREDLLTPDKIREYAQKHQVCPYEYTLDLALWADLLIGDYNHVFDPVVSLRRFTRETKSEDLFLIDEAHNLADRVRDMYTAALRKSKFYRLKKELKDSNPPAARLRKALAQANAYLLQMRKSAGGARRVQKEMDGELNNLAKEFLHAAAEWLAAERRNTHPLRQAVLDFYFEAAAFLRVADLYDVCYTTIVEIHGSETEVTLFCLDPSKIIAQRLALAKAAVLFSATLTPLPYYRDILGGLEDDHLLALPSPFDPDRLLLMAHGGISTKYRDRSAGLQAVSEAIYLTSSQKRGNYLVYFPSYEYLQQVYEVFREAYPETAVLVQQNGMEEKERERFLLRFDTSNRETLLGFCVLGGIFAEGIDLQGERLIGSIIVGVGLPKLSLRQDLILDYFQKKNGAGYDYAYVFPGMNKVLQAAGRVIRSETDFGVVLLIDSRFHTRKYRSLYPSYWEQLHMLRSSGELTKLLKDFPFFNLG